MKTHPNFLLRQGSTLPKFIKLCHIRVIVLKLFEWHTQFLNQPWIDNVTTGEWATQASGP